MAEAVLSAEERTSPSSTGSLEFTPELRLEEGYLCLNSNEQQSPMASWGTQQPFRRAKELGFFIGI